MTTAKVGLDCLPERSIPMPDGDDGTVLRGSSANGPSSSSLDWVSEEFQSTLDGVTSCLPQSRALSSRLPWPV